MLQTGQRAISLIRKALMPKGDSGSVNFPTNKGERNEDGLKCRHITG